MLAEIITVFLEDQGQDFLEWDIKDGVVVACRPYQGWLWEGTKVQNTEIHPGDYLEIQNKNGDQLTLNYPVERIEIKEV